MADSANGQTEDAELRGRIALASLHMMAGVVPRHTVDHLQARLRAEQGDYPWEEVVDTVLAERVSDEDLVNKGVVAQRNWVLRGGGGGVADGASTASISSAPRRRGPSLQTRGKTLVAALIVKGGFFVIYTVTIVMILVLLRHKWPWLDIYRLLDWLRSTLPGVFGG